MNSQRMLVLYLALSGLFLPVTVAAQSDQINVTIESLEFDCANAPQSQLERCNDLLAGAQGLFTDMAQLAAAVQPVSVIALQLELSPDSPASGAANAGEVALEASLSTQPPQDGRYLINVSASFRKDGDGATALTTSMLLAPGEDPTALGGSLETVDDGTGAVSSFRVLVLTVEKS